MYCHCQFVAKSMVNLLEVVVNAMELITVSQSIRSNVWMCKLNSTLGKTKPTYHFAELENARALTMHRQPQKKNLFA
jgi:hypothetical protein